MRVLTVGVFDCLHIGHVNLLRRAKELGDYLIVGIQTDEGVIATKDTPSLMNLEDRRIVVEAVRYVDETVPYTNVDELIKATSDLDVFAVGEDQNHARFQEAMRYCREQEIRIITLSRTPNVSSTEIKESERGIGPPGSD